MKKIIIIVLAITISMLIYREIKEDTIVIPDTAIRLRVIPNSNSSLDQKIKSEVKNYLEENTYNLLRNETDINRAREIVKANIPVIEDNIDMIFKENNYPLSYTVKYGNNYFPTKKYRGIEYREGYYESLVISIGDAEGDNWWCVLFPNLCLADIEKKDSTQYKLWIAESIDKIFN